MPGLWDGMKRLVQKNSLTPKVATSSTINCSTLTPKRKIIVDDDGLGYTHLIHLTGENHSDDDGGRVVLPLLDTSIT